MNFKYSICDCKFRNQNALGLHISKHKCEICNKVFSKPERKVSHMKNVHGKNEYSCKVCEKVFKFETRLNLHIRRDHLEKKNKLPTCNICGISFSYDYVLKGHIKSIHEGELPYLCDECELKFSSDMKNHKARIHSTDIHNCQKCDKVCKNKKALKQHINQVHIRPIHHKCTHCEKTFSNRGDMRKQWKFE